MSSRLRGEEGWGVRLARSAHRTAIVIIMLMRKTEATRPVDESSKWGTL
jgi:hypothetical protein